MNIPETPSPEPAPTLRPVSSLPVPSAGLVACLVVRDVGAAAEFYAAALGAQVRGRSDDGGQVVLAFGPSIVRLAAMNRAAGLLGAESFGGAPVTFILPVTDLDAALARALSHGAVVLRAPQAQAGTDRACMLRDPFMHVWHLVARAG
jgi:PhnB protein